MNPSLWIDLASIWVVQLARRAREQVWALARTQLKIAAIGACRGAEAKARRALAAGYYFYQERQKTSGIDINVGESGISIETK